MRIHLRLAAFLLCTFIGATELIAQNSGYYIRNYPPKSYGGFNQMWQVAQDKNGVLFCAGTSQIFIYDGFSWETVEVRAGAANRQILYDANSGTMYIGAVNDFGYLQRAVNGKWIYVSLVKKLPESEQDFADVWKVHQLDGKIYFQSSENIFVFKNGNYVTSIHPFADNTFALSFVSRNKMYVRERNVGLQEVINDRLAELPGGSKFASVRILSILRWKKESNLVLTGDNGFMIMGNDKNASDLFSPLTNESDSFLVYSGVLGAKWVNDSTIAVNSRSGVGFFDSDGHRKEIINKKSGLLDESIAELFVDREKNLWLTHNNGLAMIAYNSPERFYDDHIGYSGMMERFIRFKGHLYFATSEGVFFQEDTVKEKSGKLHLSPVKMDHTEAWSLFISGGELYAGTSMGLARIRNNKAEFLNDQYSNEAAPLKKRNGFIVAEKGSFSVYKNGNKDIELVFHAESPGVELLMASTPDSLGGGWYDCWFTTRFKYLLRAHFNMNTGEVKFREYGVANGIPAEEKYPLYLGDSVYFSEGHWAYRYVPSLDKNDSSVCFINAPDIVNYCSSGGLERMRAPLITRLFFHDPNSTKTQFYGHDEHENFFGQKAQLLHFYTDALDCFFLEEDGILWAASAQNVVRYNSSIIRPQDYTFTALIRKVTIGKDSVVLYGSDTAANSGGEFSFQYNSIAFRYAAPFYEQDGSTEFFYRLDGLDTTWTRANNGTEKSYMNLHEGTYTFRVHAFNPLSKQSKEASYTFTILPPWYRSTLAYIMYVLSFFIIIWVSIRISARRLRRQKEKLEVLVTERTAEVVEQKHQIEIQKSELESAYTDIQDSIHYAERIQNAILPMQADIAAHLPESLIYFRPRNIVSGDFYWYHFKNNKSFLACVDCTGHGVPGAFMSLIGNTLLNQIVIEKGVERADEVLNLLHEGVRHSLKQDTGGETRDGMDISFVIIDHTNGLLQYAGANRALWYVSGGSFHEIKANKCSIAGDQFEEARKFKEHLIKMKKGDVFYLSTDGYADQFGGEKGKKFMVKQFQLLLLGIAPDEMKQQRSVIEKAFLRWKGDHEQVDDVLVIGFRYI